MKPRIRVAIATLAVVAGVALAAAPPLRAEQAPPNPLSPGMHMSMRMPFGDGSFGGGPGMMIPLMLRHADLTPDQQQRVRAIIEGDRERLHKLFAELDAANDALASKVVAPGAVDLAAFKPEIDRVAQLRQDLMQQGLRTALAIRAVLTPAQIDKASRIQARLRELQAEMRQLLEGGVPNEKKP